MSVESLPLCDAGRCSVILEAIAKRDDKISGTMAGIIAAAIEATLTDLGVDHTSIAVRATLGRHLAQLSGPVSSGPVV